MHTAIIEHIKFYCIILPSVVLGWVINSDEFKLGKPKIEKKFKELHPNLDDLDSSPWLLADCLTPDSLEDICDKVLFHIFRTSLAKVRLGYLPSEIEDVQTNRVIKHARVHFSEDGAKYMTLIHCAYRLMDIFLCRGDEKRLFRLEKYTDVWGNVTYYFKSGLHPLQKPRPRTFF